MPKFCVFILVGPLGLEHSTELGSLTLDDIMFGRMRDIPAGEEHSWILPLLESAKGGSLRQIAFRFQSLPTLLTLAFPNVDGALSAPHFQGLESVLVSLTTNVETTQREEVLERISRIFPTTASRGILSLQPAKIVN